MRSVVSASVWGEYAANCKGKGEEWSKKVKRMSLRTREGLRIWAGSRVTIAQSSNKQIAKEGEFRALEIKQSFTKYWFTNEILTLG